MSHQYEKLLSKCKYDPSKYKTTDQWKVNVWRLREYLYYVATQGDNYGSGYLFPRGTDASRGV